MNLKTAALAAGMVAVLACQDPLVPELNNPTIPESGVIDNPSRSQVSQIAMGVIAGSRLDHAAYIRDAEILGRDAYNLDGADPRWTEEMLATQFDAGGFGARFWLNRYATIRTANLLLRSIATADTVGTFTPGEVRAVQGFAQTMKALELMYVWESRGSQGLPVDVGIGVDDLQPILCEGPALAAASALLDSAQTHLQAASAEFPFELPAGFRDNTTASFLEFNRAIAAKVYVYREMPTQALTALGASFLDETAPLSLGVYHNYGTGSGDTRNLLFSNARTYRAHPSVVSDAESGDLRAAKVVAGGSGDTLTMNGITSGLLFRVYSGATSPIPIITNEELILLRAEANIMAGQLGPARTDIDRIRDEAGGLLPKVYVNPTDANQVLTELLHQKRYSLLWASSSRWVDMRRYDRLGTLPLDRTGDVVHPVFPIPADESLARGGNITCQAS